MGPPQHVVRGVGGSVTPGLQGGAHWWVQPICLCALIQENTFSESPTKHAVVTVVQEQCPTHLGPIHVCLGPTLTFPFVAWEPRDRERLYTKGMRGWFWRMDESDHGGGGGGGLLLFSVLWPAGRLV